MSRKNLRILQALKCLLALYVMCMAAIPLSAGAESPEPLHETIERYALPLSNPESIDSIVRRAADKQIVLLGESTHGTEEFYRIRAEITRRLIREGGFRIVIAEGDWLPFCRVNRFIKGISDSGAATEKLLADSFKRWPPWMWANSATAELVTWLLNHNTSKTPEEKAGFYGMDVYGHWESMKAVKHYAKNSDSEKLVKAMAKYDCFAAYSHDEWAYTRQLMSNGKSCEKEVKAVVEILGGKKEQLNGKNCYEYFSAKQNAIVVQNAETYFRTAGMDGIQGWNNRVLHMRDTVKRIMDFYGEGAKAIVWAHNTHVGDARATSMAVHGQVNIGHLFRERYGKDSIYIVGFGTNRGSVMAGERWGEEGRIMPIPPGRKGSVEDLFNMISHPSFILHMDGEIPALNRVMLHRAIGVTYNPEREQGNYVPTILPQRYDSFIFIKETRSIETLGKRQVKKQE